MANKNIPQIRFKGFDGEWKEKMLGEISSFETATIPSKAIESKNYVGTENMRQLCSGVEEFKGSLSTSDIKEYKKNDILLSNIRPYLQKCWLADRNGGCSSDVIVIRSSTINPFFLYRCIAQDNFFNYVMSAVCGSKMPRGDKKHIALYSHYLPISDAEQTRIASLFTAIDKQISTSEAKLDKLRTIKKTLLKKMFAAQGELTPQIRFKGFEGAWEEKKLGEMGTTYNGLSGKTKEDFGHGKGKFITYMNVFSNSISNLDMTDSIEIDHNQNSVKYGDVFFTVSSETPNEVGMSSVYVYNEENIYLNSFCFGYRPYTNQNYNPYFFAYLLRSNTFRNKIILLAQGISRYNISKKKVMEIGIIKPQKDEEQTRIASLFTSLDKQISNQEQKIEKLRAIKKTLLKKMFV